MLWLPVWCVVRSDPRWYLFVCLFPARTIGGNISPTEMVNISNLGPLFICSTPLALCTSTGWLKIQLVKIFHLKIILVKYFISNKIPFQAMLSIQIFHVKRTEIIKYFLRWKRWKVSRLLFIVLSTISLTLNKEIFYQMESGMKGTGFPSNKISIKQHC